MFNRLKDKVKFKLAKILAPEIDKLLNIDPKIDEVDQKISSVTLYQIAPWYEENLWEPSVQIVLRDLCKPGDIVFDVGANFAGLTTVMSRMVGVNGIVCAFEASPRIIDKTQRNLVLNGCHNVQLFHTAVYHTSRQTVKIYAGDHLNDSIYSSSTQGSYHEVSTLALDDFIEYTQLTPNLLKLDIEEAEFDALQGMTKTLKTAKPHLILEAQREDFRCLNFLRDHGYIAIDLNSYQEITCIEDYPLGEGVRNNLYIHQDRRLESSYNPPFEFQFCASLSKKDFRKESSGSIYLAKTLILEKGRYLIDIDYQATGKKNDLWCGVRVKDKVILSYNAYSAYLAACYRDWIIDLPETSSITIYFEFLNGTQDQSLQVNSAQITRITNFNRSSIPLYI
jgi:FkbM family methyltransferase